MPAVRVRYSTHMVTRDSVFSELPGLSVLR